MPHIGELDQRVAIQTATMTRDSLNAEILTWSASRTVWAKVEPLRGKELLEHGAAESGVEYRVWIRWSRSLAVDAQMRLTWTRDGKTRTFDVTSVIERNADKEWLELMCKEYRSTG